MTLRARLAGKLLASPAELAVAGTGVSVLSFVTTKRRLARLA